MTGTPVRARGTRAVFAAAAALATVAALAACTGGSSGTADVTPATTSAHSGQPSGSATHPSHPRPPVTSFPTTVAALRKVMSRGVGSARTAHLFLDELAAGRAIGLDGDVKLAQGQIAEAAFDAQTSDGPITKIVLTPTTRYVLLPGDASSAKPWRQPTLSTKNSAIRTLYATLQSADACTPGSIEGLLKAATSFSYAGHTTQQGTPVGSYRLTASVKKLPAGFPLKSALEGLTITSFTAQMQVDAQGRPRLVTESIVINGSVVSAQVTLSKYNEPVHIAIPPKSKIR